MLEGLAAYRQEGLHPPPDVMDAGKAYRLKSDNVARFMETHTKSDANGAVPMSTLHSAFMSWCTSEGISSMSVKAFTQAADERGYKVKSGRHNGSNTISHVWGIKCTFPDVNP